MSGVTAKRSSLRTTAALDAIRSVLGRGTLFTDAYLRDAAAGGRSFHRATYGDGLLVFPLDGRQPYRFDGSRGLPSDDVHAVAATGDALFAWVGTPYAQAVLVRIALDADGNLGAVATLAASSRADGRTPLECRGLWHDAPRGRIVFRIDGPQGGSGWGFQGVWAYDLATRHFAQLLSLGSDYVREVVLDPVGRTVLIDLREDGRARVTRIDLDSDRVEDVPIADADRGSERLFRPQAIPAGAGEQPCFRSVRPLPGGCRILLAADRRLRIAEPRPRPALVAPR